MRIGHVLASFELGGGESVALSLAKAQRAEGHQVLAVALAAPSGAMAERFLSAEVPAYLVAKRPGFDWTLFPRLAAFFLRHRLQVAHTHNPQALVYAAPAGRLAGLRVIHTKHGEALESARRMWLRRQASRFVHAFVSVSRKTDARALSSGEGPAGKVHVIENGVDLSRFRPDGEARSAVRAELGLSPGAKLVGTAGRLETVKNHALLLRAMAPLLGDEVALVMVGDGPRRQALQDLAGKLGRLREVQFLGRRSDVPRLMAALDLFVMSSVTEGLPLVLIEAMATALPVVCTAVGGIPEVVEPGRSGLLVPSGDAEQLTRSIGALLADPEQARRMGARGREIAVERYSLDRMVARYMALYTNAK